MTGRDLAALLHTPHWMAEAACKGMPTDWWFPTVGRREAVTNEAIRICGACPVRAECKAYGADEPVGIWGGASTSKRRITRRGSAVRCGTSDGVRSGCRCETCQTYRRAHERRRTA